MAATVPNYESVNFSGVFVPAKTVATITNKLNQGIVRVLARSDMKERFMNTSVDTVGSSPEQLAEAVKSDRTWGG